MEFDLQQFATDLLSNAEKQIIGRRADTRFGFHAGDVTVFETHPQYQVWIDQQFFPPTNDAEPYRIYCDLRANMPVIDLLSDEFAPLNIDKTLSEIGLFGSFNYEFQTWQIFDPVRRLGVRTQIAPTRYEDWEPTAPLTQFLNWIVQAEGGHVLHAATLGWQGVGALLVGQGGSGKSGTTLAGLQHGLLSVGDDYTIVRSAEGVSAYPLTRTLKQDSEGLARVGISYDPAQHGSPNWQNKYCFPWLGQNFVNELRIKSILLPCVTGRGKTEISPTHAKDAMNALMPSTVRQLHGDRMGTFAICAKLARELPAYRIELGTDPKEITACLRDFFEGGMA